MIHDSKQYQEMKKRFLTEINGLEFEYDLFHSGAISLWIRNKQFAFNFCFKQNQLEYFISLLKMACEFKENKDYEFVLENLPDIKPNEKPPDNVYVYCYKRYFAPGPLYSIYFDIGMFINFDRQEHISKLLKYLEKALDRIPKRSSNK